MYDIEISANIISTLKNEEFINEVNLYIRVGILLAFCLLNVGLITLLHTKWMIVNLVLNLLLLIILNAAGCYLIVLAFSKGYFLELNELTVLFIITTIYTAASLRVPGRKEESSYS